MFNDGTEAIRSFSFFQAGDEVHDHLVTGYRISFQRFFRAGDENLYISISFFMESP